MVFLRVEKRRFAPTFGILCGLRAVPVRDREGRAGKTKRRRRGDCKPDARWEEGAAARTRGSCLDRPQRRVSTFRSALTLASDSEDDGFTPSQLSRESGAIHCEIFHQHVCHRFFGDGQALGPHAGRE